MLSCLYVENIAIIRKLSIDFLSGFTILSGETGAGKSLLIDSIQLLLGGKGKRDLIGPFGERSFVKATFTELSEEIKTLLSAQEIDCLDDELFIERKIGKDGRSVAKINSVQIPISFLQELAPHLINIHGQHDHILMLDTSRHIDFLDQYADLTQPIEHYKCEYELLRSLRSKVSDLSELAQRREILLSKLGFKLAEFERISPCVGMLDFLQNKRRLLQNQKAVLDFVSTLKLDDEHSIVSNVSLALNQANKLIETDTRFKEIYLQLCQTQELLSSVLIQAEDVADEFTDSDGLNEVEDKIYDLQNLLSKYGPTEEDLLLDWEDTQKQFNSIEQLDSSLDGAKEAYLEQLRLVQSLAKEISDARISAAKSLSEKVRAELAFLDMKGVQFEVSVQQTKNNKGGYVYNSKGYDRVEFLISGNIGQEARALSKIASGGELSRIMLSLTNVLNQQSVHTMIFDEVDSGVSGRTAEKIGLKLKEVSENQQVLCITHLAQIASMGDHHFKIFKHSENGATETEVTLLAFNERVDELSRIIGGIDITDSIRKTAKEMLEKNK